MDARHPHLRTPARRARLQLVRQGEQQRNSDQDRHRDQRLFPAALEPARHSRFYLPPRDRAIVLIGAALILAIVVYSIALARRPAVTPVQAPFNTQFAGLRT